MAKKKRSLNASYRDFVDASRHVLFLRLDATGRIRDMNGAARALLDWLGESEGGSFLAVLPGAKAEDGAVSANDLLTPWTADPHIVDFGERGVVPQRFIFRAEKAADNEWRVFGEPDLGLLHDLTERHEKLRTDFMNMMRVLGKSTAERQELAQGLEEVQRHLERTARLDPVTELPNRREFLISLHQEHARFRRYGRVYSVAIAEATGLEELTDTEGMAAADAGLRIIGEALRTRLRANDLPARFGDRQFAVLQVETDGIAAALVADRLQQAVAERRITTPSGRAIGLRVGASAVDISDTHPEDALRRAAARLKDSLRPV